ncbi:MAG: type II secretion system F family protein [Armatimonadia bacterium]
MYLTQLGDMLNAGLTMRDSMEQMASHALDFRLRRMSREIADAAAAGRSLTGELANYPQIVPPHVRGMIMAGERAGALPRVCQELAEELRQQQSLKWKAAIGEVYFGLIFVLAVLVPGLMRIIDPKGPQWYLYLDYLRNVAAPILVGTFVVWNLAKLIGAIPVLLGPVQMLLYYLPGSRQLIRQAALTRFLVSLDALLRAGVQIQEALALAAQATGNVVLEKSLTAVAERVRAGQPIEQALRGSTGLTRDIAESLILAQRAGTYEHTLDVMMQHWREGRSRLHWVMLITAYGVLVLISAVAIIFIIKFAMTAYVNGIFKFTEDI